MSTFRAAWLCRGRWREYWLTGQEGNSESQLPPPPPPPPSTPMSNTESAVWSRPHNESSRARFTAPLSVFLYPGQEIEDATGVFTRLWLCREPLHLSPLDCERRDGIFAGLIRRKLEMFQWETSIGNIKCQCHFLSQRWTDFPFQCCHLASM